ncbi:hypothetical protein AX16_002277 [Volvariella volvacea WC 439]|nr:hypothetical protein AX16_002277 [Volvariella volvacea WC 439]
MFPRLRPQLSGLGRALYRPPNVTTSARSISTLKQGLRARHQDPARNDLREGAIRRWISTSQPRWDNREYIRFGSGGGGAGGESQRGKWGYESGGGSGGPPPERPHEPWDGRRRWDGGMRVGSAIVILGGVYYLAHLEQVPETGRWRFMNTSPRFEAQMAELLRKETHEEFQNTMLPPSHPISRHVRKVATRIISSANLGTVIGEPQTFGLSSLFDGDGSGGDAWNPDEALSRKVERQWEVIVVNDPKMVNAAALPGVIIVYTGILPVCRDEQGLAAVLSHEIGHVVARHTAERISSQTVWLGLMIVLQILGLDWGISNLAQKFLLELPNSRTQEREADVIGLKLMSNACYDPKAAPEMFQRLGQVEKQISGRAGMDFFRTHPTSENRVKYLEEILPEGYAILAANPDCGVVQDQLHAFQEATGGGVRTVPITRDMLNNL